jgi:mRNA-degrading endonuclease RelE of RelBE toxin-antitoxin system
MWAEFRLRVNGFRIYYNVYDDRGVVEVLRILWKDTGQTPGEPP